MDRAQRPPRSSVLTFAREPSTREHRPARHYPAGPVTVRRHPAKLAGGQQHVCGLDTAVMCCFSRERVRAGVGAGPDLPPRGHVHRLTTPRASAGGATGHSGAAAQARGCCCGSTLAGPPFQAADGCRCAPFGRRLVSRSVRSSCAPDTPRQSWLLQRVGASASPHINGVAAAVECPSVGAFPDVRHILLPGSHPGPGLPHWTASDAPRNPRPSSGTC